MKLKTEDVTIDKVKFTVKELNVTEFMPLMNGVDDGDEQEFTAKLFKASVLENGKPIDLENLPARVYLKLLPIVVKFNGQSEETEGNVQG